MVGLSKAEAIDGVERAIFVGKALNHDIGSVLAVGRRLLPERNVVLVEHLFALLAGHWPFVEFDVNHDGTHAHHAGLCKC